MHLSRPYSLPTPLRHATQSTTQEKITPLRIAPGQGLWCYLEAASSLYCTAGLLQISSPWSCALRLAAGDAPHCNGAHTGWYWLEAEGADPVQLQVAEPITAGWRGAWQAAAQWLGWPSR